MELIYCRGGDKQYTKTVLDMGWSYGLRSDYVSYADDVMFLDIHYQLGRSAWSHHIERALELRPKLTMIPDWESEYTHAELFALHEQLANAGLQTMWTPKQHGIVEQIPDESVIGVSVPTRHGSFLPCADAVAGKRLHMLGGDPDAIRYLMDKVYFDSVIYSIDTSYFVRKAFNGQYWSSTLGKWIQLRNNEFSNADLIILSAIGIKEYLLADTVPEFNMSRAPIKRIWNTLNDVNTIQLELAI